MTSETKVNNVVDDCLTAAKNSPFNKSLESCQNVLKSLFSRLLLSTLGLMPFPAAAAEPQIKIAQAGQNITLWDGWNVDATIFIKIDAGEGDDCIRLWWITMGINSEAWEVCNQAEVEVKFPLIYGELRAGHFSRQTAVAVSDQAGVAYSFELCDGVIEC